MTIRQTGAVPDRQETREIDRVHFNFADQTSFAGPLITGHVIVQPMAWVRDQPKFPDCVGEGTSAYIDSKLPGPPWSSAVSIWRDARRRQGRIEQIELGTRIEYAVESLLKRGWDPYRPGEETDEEEAGKGAPDAGDDLDDELFAYDERLPKGLARYRIIGVGSAVLDAVDEALRRDFGVLIGTYLAAPFLSHMRTEGEPEIILGKPYFAGAANSHAMRVRGVWVVNGRRVYLIQNSWGRNFGGCYTPDGVWQPGCVLVDEAVIVACHDVHVLELPPYPIALN